VTIPKRRRQAQGSPRADTEGRYPDSASALEAFRRLLDQAAKRGGTHRGRVDPSHPDDRI
jgi:hypothetical protein